jgi:uncharacterized protein YmfQ (DUF2313 family)
MTGEPRTPEQYAKQALALEPRGLLWSSRDPDANRIKLYQGHGEEASRVEGRGLDLLEELDPRITAELLEDYERLLDMAGDCVGIQDLATDRQRAIHEKLTILGSESPQAFIDAARRVNFIITIEEHFAMIAGPFGPLDRSKAGDAITQGSDWAHTFTVHSVLTGVTEFKAGSGRCIDPLRVFGNDVLECVVNRKKPAHTQALFSYGGFMGPEPAQWGVAFAIPPYLLSHIDSPSASLTAPHAGANLPGLAGFYGAECGVFEAVGTKIWASVFVRLPDLGETPIDEYEFSLNYGGVPTPLAASKVEYDWVGSNLVVVGGAGSGYTEDVGGGWWRMVLTWTVTATETGQEKFFQIKLPRSASPSSLFSYFSGGMFTTAAP